MLMLSVPIKSIILNVVEPLHSNSLLPGLPGNIRQEWKWIEAKHTPTYYYKSFKVMATLEANLKSYQKNLGISVDLK